MTTSVPTVIFPGMLSLVEQIGDDIRSADEQHDRSEDMRQVLGHGLENNKARDAEDGKQQCGRKGDFARDFLTLGIAVHFDLRQVKIPLRVRPYPHPEPSTTGRRERGSSGYPN